MRKLIKKHESQVRQNAENASLCVHPSFMGSLIEVASRYEVEKLLQNDNVIPGGFSVHTPTEGSGPFPRRPLFSYQVIPVGRLWFIYNL